MLEAGWRGTPTGGDPRAKGTPILSPALIAMFRGSPNVFGSRQRLPSASHPQREALFLTNDPNALSGKHEESRVTGINPSSVSHLLDGVRQPIPKGGVPLASVSRVEESVMAHAHDAGSTGGTPSNACFGSEPSRCERSWASKLRKWRSPREVIDSPAPQASRSTILSLSGTLSMSLFRFLEPLSRCALRKMGVLPPRPSRQRDFFSPPPIRPSVERLVEHHSDAALRRREKYVVAVGLSVAISAALAGTVWAGAVTEDAARGQTFMRPAKIVARSTKATSEGGRDCLAQLRRAPAGRAA
jgi:hypothetical protein